MKGVKDPPGNSKADKEKGIVTTNTRIKQLVEEKTTPRNRDEQEIAGYRDALNIIHESFDSYVAKLHFASSQDFI